MMTTDDTLATTTIQCDQPLKTPPSASPTQPSDPTPQIHLYLAQRISHLERYSLDNPTFLRHPKLTEQLRTLPDFPLLKRAYPVESPDMVTNTIYYDQLVRHCYGFFKEDLIAAGQQVKHWILTLGRLEQTPIVDSFQVNAKGWVEYCVISGLRWDIPTHSEQIDQWMKYLDFHELFSIDRQKQIRMEDAIPGSPLISLYIQDNHSPEGHNGQLFWYNLETRRPGQMIDAVRYRK